MLLAECLSILLLQDGSDELLDESRQAMDTVFRGVSDASLQRSFLARLESHGHRQTKRKIDDATVRSYG